MRAILSTSRVRNYSPLHHLAPPSSNPGYAKTFKERSACSTYRFLYQKSYKGISIVGKSTSKPFTLFTGYSTKGAKHVEITFVDRDGDSRTVQAKVGDTLLDVAKEYDIDVEGACGGTLACSTCHLIFDKVTFDNLPNEPTDEELDMLEMAYALTDTSRLGCQIDVSEDMDGIVLKVPTETRDARDL